MNIQGIQPHAHTEKRQGDLEIKPVQKSFITMASPGLEEKEKNNEIKSLPSLCVGG